MATFVKRTGKRGVTYQAKVRLLGHPPQSATFPRLTDAKRWAAQTETAIREGRYFKTVEAQRHTVAEMIDRYIREVLPTKPRSAASQGPQLRWWKERLGGYTLAECSPPRIAEARDKLAKTVHRRGAVMAPATVNRYLAALSHAFTIAMREWEWIEDNPVSKVNLPKEPRGRVRFLSDDERERLLAACRESSDPFLYPVVILALSTGMRAGELLGTTWDRVDLERGRILLEETKNDERRLIPLAGHALELLRMHNKVRRLGTDLVWPGRINPNKPANVQRAWRAARTAAGIENFKFHDLRHSCASYLAMNGASLAEIAEVLGHKSFEMVKRYAHLSDAHTAGVVERMNEAVFGKGEE